MSRTVKLGADRVLTSPSEVVVELDQDDVAILALELTLLLRRMSDLVSIVSGSNRLTLTLLDQAPPAKFSRDAIGRIQCSLSRDSAEYLEATLLRAFRDGMADVNHVHVEGKLDGESFDLTLLFAVSRPPMTPEEADKVMGS